MADEDFDVNHDLMAELRARLDACTETSDAGQQLDLRADSAIADLSRAGARDARDGELAEQQHDEDADDTGGAAALSRAERVRQENMVGSRRCCRALYRFMARVMARHGISRKPKHRREVRWTFCVWRHRLILRTEMSVHFLSGCL